MKDNLLFVRHFCLSLPLICSLMACQKDHQQQQYILDQNASAMEWKGYLKDGSGNNGTINVAGKLFLTEPWQITGGQVNLPLASLININLPTDELKHQLIHHLQSEDFFNMVAYPEISFKITSVIPDKDISHIYHASGDLTILGKTRSVNFPVQIKLQGNQLEVTGETSIDRTLWGMDYASDENAADGMYIKPDIDVHFKLVAIKR